MPTYAEMVDPLKPKIPNVPPPAPMAQPEIAIPAEEPAPMEESPSAKLERLDLMDILDYLKGKGIVPKDFIPETPVAPPMEPTFEEMSINPPVSVAGGI